MATSAEAVPVPACPEGSDSSTFAADARVSLLAYAVSLVKAQ